MINLVTTYVRKSATEMRSMYNLSSHCRSAPYFLGIKERCSDIDAFSFKLKMRISISILGNIFFKYFLHLFYGTKMTLAKSLAF
jgi:hypothetical protein